MSIVKCLLFIQLSCGLCAYADQAGHEEFVHGIAHVGASYMVNTVSYGVWSKTVKMGKAESLILSALDTFLIGLLYKVQEGASSEDTFRAAKLNLVGTALSAGTVLVFQF